MGIPGLTRYIEERADYYLQPFELHDTCLIVDGWSLCSQLYCASGCNDAFGGDYGQYAEYVFQFFNDLLQCKVTPLVILDGGWEAKKELTLIERHEERIKVAGSYSMGDNNDNRSFQQGRRDNRGNNNNKNRQAVFPLLAPDTFIDIMKKLEIKYTMCMFEADDSVASIGKLLNVPVLSYDSDFFIYGVDYIPFNTLDSYIVKYAKGYVKKCRIYRTNTLLKRFKGLDITLLPLASVLLGNDYISSNTFREFFDHLGVQRRSSQYNGRQQQIERIFNWLKNYTLNDAVVAILKRLPIEKRREVLKSIEIIVNGYLSLSTYMLRPLGINEETILDMQKNFKTFKFEGDIQNLELEIKDTRDFHHASHEVEETSENKFAALVPKWFIDDLVAAKFPLYFVNIITHLMYIISIQIEDFSCPSAQKISVPIISVICSILTTTKYAKANHGKKVIQLLIREGFEMDRQDLTVPLSPIPFEDIRISSVILRKKIINDALGIRVSDKLNELPSSWQLYFAAILFWMRHNDEIERTTLHLDALLMTSLIGIIDRTIGFNRINKTSRRKFLDEFTRKQEEKRFEKIVGNEESMAMVDLINSVTREDCTAALPFFEDHARINTKSNSMPENFCISIVHVYAQVQSCLKHAMHLNALLGHIYVQPSPSEFLNGTLFYNLYRDFSTKLDVHAYIDIQLERSLGLLKLFKAMNQKISDALKNTTFDKERLYERKVGKIQN